MASYCEYHRGQGNVQRCPPITFNELTRRGPAAQHDAESFAISVLSSSRQLYGAYSANVGISASLVTVYNDDSHDASTDLVEQTDTWGSTVVVSVYLTRTRAVTLQNYTVHFYLAAIHSVPMKTRGAWSWVIITTAACVHKTAQKSYCT